ncbi:MAG: 3-dehydroquinate synthase [Trueperaceae bacterium]
MSGATAPLRVRVALEPAYAVWVGADDDLLPAALADAGAERASRVAIVSDAHVAAAGHATRAAGAWASLGVEAVTLVVPAGEDSKSVAAWADLHARLAAAACDRDTWVCAVGGGVVGDLAGFVAASWLRGVPFVQVPTTLLAMVDASVGGKTGIDLASGKNLVGAFWQPRVVVADTRALATLPPAVLREGAVELYKHALLADAPWRAAFGPPDAFGLPDDLDDAAWARLVADGIRVKAEVVAADPHEAGVRAHLNLGHTLAHALEAVTGHAMRHGTAVAYGLAFAAELGGTRGWADWRADAAALVGWAADAPLPDVPLDALLAFMARDKKRRGGRLRFVLLADLGRPLVVDDVRPAELARAWEALRARFPGGPA